MVNKLEVTLTEPLDTMSELYGFNADKCKKVLTLIDEKGTKLAGNYNRGVLTLS